MADALEDRVMEESFEPTDEELPPVYGARVVADRATLPALATSSQGLTVSLAGDDAAIANVLRQNHLVDPKVLDERTPYFWPAEISSARLDSHDTRMDPETTLQNYANDLIAGVAFCNSHRHNELNFGRSFAGLYIDGGSVGTEPGTDAPNPATVYGAFYTFPDLNLNSVNTNDLIFGIRSGITKDVSVGFKRLRDFMYRCSVCGENIWSWDCPHIPGDVETIVVDEASGRTEERYCYAWVVNGGLSEVTACYDGSTPNAMIIKATREARMGRISTRALHMVEAMTRRRMPKRRAVLPGHVPAPKEEKRAMGDENKEKEEQARLGSRALELLLGAKGKRGLPTVREMLTRMKVDVEADAEPDDVVRALSEHIEELEERADRGDKLFESLVKEALGEGVRALGDKFDEKAWEARLRKLDPEEVLDRRNMWREDGDKLLGVGRKTKDEAGKPPKGERGEGEDDEDGERSSDAGDEDDYMDV
jgi:hypothetical protein